MPTADTPTRVRYVIVLVAMLAAVLLYVERTCLGVAEVFIREDLHISKAGMDWVLSAFFLAYALGQVPGGWLAQRYGPRLMMTCYMLGLALFGAFIAFSQDVVTLFLSRLLLGISQAGAYPTAALLVKRWVPDERRGLASSVVAFGGRFGGAIANWVTGPLIVLFVPLSTPATVTPEHVLDLRPITAPTDDMRKAQEKAPALASLRAEVRTVVTTAQEGDRLEALNRWVVTPNAFAGVDWPFVALSSDGKRIQAVPVEKRSAEESARLNRLVLEKAFPGAVRQLHTDGWRPTLLVFAALAAVVAVVFWVIARDRPTDHPRCNEAERQLIVRGQLAAGQTAGSNAIPWKELIRSRNQWLFSASQFFTNIGWVILITFVPRYLDERFSVPVDERAFQSTVPLFGSAVGMIFGGWLTDRIARRHGLRAGRAIPAGLFKLPCVVAMAVCPFLPTAWAVVFALTVMAICTDIGVPPAWAFAQDTGGRQAATVLGWGNMWGNLGAFAGTKLLGTMQTEFGLDAMTYFSAGAFVFAGIAAMLANAAEPLFGEGTKKAD